MSLHLIVILGRDRVERNQLFYLVVEPLILHTIKAVVIVYIPAINKLSLLGYTLPFEPWFKLSVSMSTIGVSVNVGRNMDIIDHIGPDISSYYRVNIISGTSKPVCYCRYLYYLTRERESYGCLCCEYAVLRGKIVGPTSLIRRVRRVKI